MGASAPRNNGRLVGYESGYPSYPVWSTAFNGRRVLLCPCGMLAKQISYSYGNGDPNAPQVTLFRSLLIPSINSVILQFCPAESDTPVINDAWFWKKGLQVKHIRSHMAAADLLMFSRLQRRCAVMRTCRRCMWHRLGPTLI
jgi:hypothetical protein